ncbi:MAG: DNA repair protein RecN, partial [Clostridia bacterium]|nr:DNA repair protein RecN [Clostridia bacterium]
VIKNIALIESAEIEFGPNLNILSGETGSGKSVILDSLNFILGSKADKSMIRYGTTEATVRGEFYTENGSAAAEALKELDIESDGEIIITRKYTADGKGNIKINGNTVTASMLKSVTRHLVDVYGQSEHFALLSESNQLKVLDSLCGEGADKIKDELAQKIAVKRDCEKKIKTLGGDSAERARRLDILSYQINEIESAQLSVGEEEELTARQKIIDNTERIAEAAGGAFSLLHGDGGCSDSVSAAKRMMASVSDIHSDYSAICDRLEAVTAELDDISDTLYDITDSLDFDEEEAKRIDERLTLIKGLKKKYGGSVEAVLEFYNKASEEFALISDSESAVERLNEEIEKTDGEIYSLCLKLTALRKECAKKFCSETVEQLKSLNISGARFNIDFTDYTRETACLTSANGSDNILFMFSANAGEPLKPLSKVISGGELSRFMLALKAQMGNLSGVSTYIFDEIDSGISGITANRVTEKFVAIAKSTQVIAVSHLPQICAAGDKNFLINKCEQGGSTVTMVKELSPEEKINEIVRLTGGTDSPSAREHAKELIAKYK